MARPQPSTPDPKMTDESLALLIKMTADTRGAKAAGDEPARDSAVDFDAFDRALREVGTSQREISAILDTLGPKFAGAGQAAPSVMDGPAALAVTRLTVALQALNRSLKQTISSSTSAVSGGPFASSLERVPQRIVEDDAGPAPFLATTKEVASLQGENRRARKRAPEYARAGAEAEHEAGAGARNIPSARFSKDIAGAWHAEERGQKTSGQQQGEITRLAQKLGGKAEDTAAILSVLGRVANDKAAWAKKIREIEARLKSASNTTT